MLPKTAELWAKQNQHDGDRWRLFRAIADAVECTSVLYPGCYVDITPSFVFPSVTYVDIDKRAPRFFGDAAGVREIIAAHDGPADPEVAFIHADYSAALDLPDAHYDLLVSLYAGFVSEHCSQHVCLGGTLLVNPSHGDAAMASIDPRYELSGAIISSRGAYRVDRTDLENRLIPRKPQAITVEQLHESCRGIAYTNPAFAYLFTRVA